MIEVLRYYLMPILVCSAYAIKLNQHVVGIPYDCSKLQFWNWMARAETCNTSRLPYYHCAWDIFNHRYEELCWSRLNLIRKGQRPTIQPGLHYGDCPTDRYQPVPVVSNYTTDCWYKKYKCSEEGQIIYNDTLPDVDSTCRCDYKNQYAFVQMPKNTCFCNPSQEDCSCFKKFCENVTYVLNAEYQCVEEDYNLSLSLCPPIHAIMVKPRGNSDSIMIADVSLRSFISGCYAAWFGFSVCLVFAALVPYLFFASRLCFFQQKHFKPAAANQSVSCNFDVYGFAWISKVHLYLNDTVALHDDERCRLAILNDSWWHRTVMVTIDNVKMTDQGNLKCVLWNWIGFKYTVKSDLYVAENSAPNTEEKKFDIELKKERNMLRTRKRISKHNSDAFYAISALIDGNRILEEFNLLAIIGHEGSGKTKSALHLSKLYADRNFCTMWFSTNDDLHEISQQINDKKSEIYVFDINLDPLTCTRTEKDLIETVKESTQPQSKFIFTVKSKFRDKWSLHFPTKNQLNINSLTPDDKSAILLVHLQKNNIHSCQRYLESNYENHEIIDNLSMEVRLYEKVIQDIINAETVMGYPQYCSTFCSNRMLLPLEDRFFKNPSKSAIKEISQLRAQIDRVQYVVLIYILMKEHLDPRSVDEKIVHDICNKLKIQPCPNYVVRDAAISLEGKYLMEKSGKYEFDDSVVKRAVWASYIDIDAVYCLTSCPWEYIFDLVRPLSWPSDQNDVCIYVENENILLRLELEIKGYGTVRMVGSYLRKLTLFCEELTSTFCKHFHNIKCDADVALNFFNGLSDSGHDDTVFRTCVSAKEMLSKHLDKFNNCIIHFCVLQDFNNIVNREGNKVEHFINLFNLKGCSPCHLAFYLGRRQMIEKHIESIPRIYQYYKRLKDLCFCGEKKSGNVVKPKDLKIVGIMELESNVIQKSKFGTREDFKSIKDLLQRLKSETMVMLRIKNIPLNIDDDTIERELILMNCTVIKLYRERRRENGVLTKEKTGDRIAICKPLEEILPNIVRVKGHEGNLLTLQN